VYAYGSPQIRCIIDHFFIKFRIVCNMTLNSAIKLNSKTALAIKWFNVVTKRYASYRWKSLNAMVMNKSGTETKEEECSKLLAIEGDLTKFHVRNNNNTNIRPKPLYDVVLRECISSTPNVHLDDIRWNHCICIQASRDFRHAGPSIWNSLPSNLRPIGSNKLSSQ